MHGSFGLTTLKEMILTRPKQRNELLRALLDFTCYERQELRHHSLEIAKELYSNPAIRENVKVRTCCYGWSVGSHSGEERFGHRVFF